MLLEHGIERAIRNALVRAQRDGRTIVRDACGTYDQCGGAFDSQGVPYKLPKTSRCCPLCAVLLVKDISLIEKDPEAKMAEIFDVTSDWIVSFLQGWDGDEPTNATLSAWKIGKRLWKIFENKENES